MSETTNTPEPDETAGTFVGGTFGRPDETDADHAENPDTGMPTTDLPTTAEALEADAEQVHTLAAGVEAPAETEEFVGDAIPPGERNEPV